MPQFQKGIIVSEAYFCYSYDAYGNYELITENGSAAEQLMATMLHSLNPLTYRGYVFAPAIGKSYYLASRFYVPQLCRFMNADVYADTAQGAVGTNMFAYCNNNPISLIDPEGTNGTVTGQARHRIVFCPVRSIYKNTLPPVILSVWEV